MTLFGRDRGSLYAGLFLTCSAFGMGNPIESASTAAAQIAGAAFDILFCVGFFSLYLLAEELGRDGLGPRTARALRCTAIGAIAAGAVLALANRLLVWNVGCFVPFNDAASLALDAVVVICALAILGRATMDKRVEDRRRAQWTLVERRGHGRRVLFRRARDISPRPDRWLRVLGRRRHSDRIYLRDAALPNVRHRVRPNTGGRFDRRRHRLGLDIRAREAGAQTVRHRGRCECSQSMLLCSPSCWRSRFAISRRASRESSNGRSFVISSERSRKSKRSLGRLWNFADDAGKLLSRVAGVVYSATAATGVAILVRSGRVQRRGGKTARGWRRKSIDPDDPALREVAHARRDP